MMETGLSPSRSRQITRQAPPRRLERPSLDRPSLFAGMEAGDSIVPEDDDTGRGGILSALESARQRKPMPHIRGEDVRPKSVWPSRLLVGLMATGVLALLGGFVMVVRDGHPQVAVHAPAAPDLAALPATGAGRPASTDVLGASSPSAAVIESTASASPVVEQAGTATSPEASTAPVLALTPPPQAVPPVGPDAKAAAAKSHVAKAEGAAPAQTTRSSAGGDKPARQTGKRQADADVALLEAMFHHSQTRTPPSAAGPGVAEQIRSACGSLSGAAAATCRARICVNNPASSACHDGE